MKDKIVTLTKKIPNLQEKYVGQVGKIIHVFKNNDVAVMFKGGKTVIAQKDYFLEGIIEKTNGEAE